MIEPDNNQLSHVASGRRPGNAGTPLLSDGALICVAAVISAIALVYFYLVDKFFFSTSFMSQIFALLLVIDDSKTAWLAFGVSILAAFWTYPRPILRIVDFLGDHIRAVVLGVVALLAVGALTVYHNYALCMDEYAAVFQAKIFATGRLFAQLPPSIIDWLVPPGFNGVFIVASRATGRAISCYWPGFAAILAPFELLGVPWLCNPILAGVALLLIFRISLQITGDRRAAGWAVLFTVASGAFVANAISYYSMQAHLTASLLFVWLLMVPTPRRAFAAGVVGSFALVLHNPFPHTLFAAPWLIAFARSKELRRPCIALALGYLPILLMVGAGWLRLRAFVTAGDSGYDVLGNNLTNDFSFPDKSMFDMRIAAAIKMLIWASPGVFLFAVMGRLRWGENQHVRLMTQSAVVTFVGYLFVIFDQGHGWGYRYFHAAWGVVPILAGCAMARRDESSSKIVAFAGASALLSLIVIVPFQMIQIDEFISTHLAQLPKPHRPGNNVYLVALPGGFYTADMVQMDPFLRDQDLILSSRGPELDAELRRQNWPEATLVGRAFRVEEWNLGPQDRRRASSGSTGQPQLDIAFSHPANFTGPVEPPKPDKLREEKEQSR